MEHLPRHLSDAHQPSVEKSRWKIHCCVHTVMMRQFVASVASLCALFVISLWISTFGASVSQFSPPKQDPARLRLVWGHAGRLLKLLLKKLSGSQASWSCVWVTKPKYEIFRWGWDHFEHEWTLWSCFSQAVVWLFCTYDSFLTLCLGYQVNWTVWVRSLYFGCLFSLFEFPPLKLTPGNFGATHSHSRNQDVMLGGVVHSVRWAVQRVSAWSMMDNSCQTWWR